MRKISTTLAVKFALTFIAAYFTIGIINHNSTGWVFTLALLGTFLNYLIGDLFILRRTGNIFTALMDGALSGLTAFILNLASRNFNTNALGLIYFGILVAIAEFFFHQYLKSDRKVEP